jgi:hypothetical protein
MIFMASMRDDTTISIKKKTKKLLEALVIEKNETYDDIIMRLMKYYINGIKSELNARQMGQDRSN